MILDYQSFDHHQYHEHEFEDMMSTNHRVTIRPTDKELDSIAKDMQELFQNKIQWHDIPIIMKLATHYIEEFSNINLESYRDSVIHILYYIIDHTDTLYLPDLFSDHILKSISPHFVNIIIPESLNEYLTPIKISGLPTDDLINEYAQEIFVTFEDGFQWKDLATISKLGILFANQFTDLNFEQKKITAKAFVDYVIDSTDTLKLPKYFVSSIFKEINDEVIEIIIDQLLIR